MKVLNTENIKKSFNFYEHNSSETEFNFQAISEGIGLGKLKSILQANDSQISKNSNLKHESKYNMFDVSQVVGHEQMKHKETNNNRYLLLDDKINFGAEFHKLQAKMSTIDNQSMYFKLSKFFITHLIDLVVVSITGAIVLVFLNLIFINIRNVDARNIFYILSIQNFIKLGIIKLIPLIYSIFIIYFIFFKIIFRHTLGQIIYLKLKTSRSCNLL